MKNFFSKLTQGFSKAKTKAVAFFSSPFSQINGSEDWFDVLNLGAFRDSLYLFIGVSMIRETVSSIPLQMFRIKNADGDTEEVNDDPLLDLIERPNYRQTQKEFWKLAVAYYLLAGETFWYLERNGSDRTSVPTAMANLRPDHVEVLFSADKSEVIGYQFTKNNGEMIKLPPEAILHIKNIDPVNPARGIGVIRPATQRIVTEREASEYQAATFKNQGRPDIAIFTDTELTDEQAEDARERWNKIYGKDRGSAAGFFGNAVKDMKLLNVNPKEMEFMGTQNFLRDDILAALRVPKAMITSDDVNLANSQTARINYIKEACLPVLDAFIDIINNKLLNDVAEDKFVTYDNPVNEDREILLKEATELKGARIITVNEARELMNYPAIEGGDVREEAGGLFQLAMKQKRLRPVAKRLLKKRPVLLRKFNAVTAVAKMIEAEKMLDGVKRGRNSVFHTAEMKERYIKAFNDRIDRKAKGFHDTLVVYNNDFLQRIEKYMREFGVNADRFFDVSTELVEAKKIFVPLIQTMYQQAGQDVMEDIATGFAAQKASEHFYTITEVLQALEHRAEFFIGSMLDTDFSEMRDIIAVGLQDGLGVEEIGRKLRDYFDDMSVSRARTIARTETGRLVSQATNDAYQQSAVVTGKEWLTTRDSKVRNVRGTVNDHVVNDGKIVGKNEVFPNGEQYPGQYTINCRCAIAPAV